MVMMPELPTVQHLSDGVTLDRLQPGGKDGPGDAVLESEQLGGGVWSEVFSLGRPEDPWRMAIPDVRMARNQYWPMHWHDCWISVVILDGCCLLGDWWMYPGDVVVSPASVEYGPLLNGPRGCQLIEVFARDVDSPGGYSREFHDHPVLEELQSIKSHSTSPASFMTRPNVSAHNEGNQTTPLDTVPGLSRGHLRGNQRFDLGEPDDPERGVMLDTKLAGDLTIPARRHRDWRGILIYDGSMTVGGHALTKDDLLLIEPDAPVAEFVTGPDGVHLIEWARTSRAVPQVFDAKVREAPQFREGLSAIQDAVFE
jgi:hypothetical protein